MFCAKAVGIVIIACGIGMAIGVFLPTWGVLFAIGLICVGSFIVLKDK